VYIQLGLTGEPQPAVPCRETESPQPPADEISPLDEALRHLELLEPEPAEPTSVPQPEAVHSAVPEDVAEAVVYWLQRYTGNRSEAARNIRALAAKEPKRVVETLLPLYEAGRFEEAAPFLAALLSSDDGTAAKLCDPSASLEGSVRVAKALTRQEPRFDARFAKSLLNDDQMSEVARQRGLAVLEKLGSAGRLIPILIQFLRNPDGRVRSKAALMFGQIMSARGIMERLMEDADSRVRANLVEGLWNSTGSLDPRPLFRQALGDRNHRVVGNALVGLHRLGEHRDVIMHVGKMARHKDALFRASAAWVMGQTGDERYSRVLRHMLRDPDRLVRSNALRSLRRINLARAARQNVAL
jgi:HEAT repeat protein